jgi:hypothetical protein
MSMTLDDHPPSPLPRLSFASTVDRALIHRRNPDESFLTDAVRVDARRFAAAAVLPPAHPHYAGHTGPSRLRDPMLLLECARQAETYAAHTMFGVAPDARFVLRTWSAEFAVDDVDDAPVTGGPAELLMTAVTGDPRLLRGRICGLNYDLALWAAGVRAGRVSMDVGYLNSPAYAVLRSRKHHGPPPSSDDVVPPSGRPVDPARVGRVRPADVVLLDAATGAGSVGAVLRVPVDNPSLFDHAQDHIPAMVLMEGARQIAALATHLWGGAAPDRTVLAAMNASFAAFAELTEPTELTATPVAAVRPVAGRLVDVAFRQAGTEIAHAQVVMAVPAPAAEAGPRGTT